jgi:HK97 family phage major capsid protein
LTVATKHIDDLTVRQVYDKRREVEDEIINLGSKRDAGRFTAGEQEHFDRLQRQHERLVARCVEIEDKQQWREDIGRRQAANPDHFRTYELPERADMVRTLDGAQERALRSLERVQSDFRSAMAVDTQDRLIRKDPRYAADFEARSRDEYLSAFGKILRAGSIGDAAAFMSDAERQSMYDMSQCRTLVEGQTTTGGFAVPIVLDPSVILTDQENTNPFLQICRVEDVTSNNWKGVSAAGAQWSFDAEAAEVSDDSITLAQPTVDVRMARGFIPYSIEVGEDWPGFNAEMARILSAGYDDLLLRAFTTGSGVAPNPMGLLTSLDATPTSEVVVTTDGAFGQEDVYKVWAALPAKYHRNASWMMSGGVNNRIRQMGQANMYHAYTVNLAAGAADVLMGSQIFENPYFPDYTGTTGAANLVVVGDFSNMVIARRTGLSVELVPHLVGSGSRFPLGMRGLFAYGRVGSGVVNSAGFRLLQNQ